MLRNDLRACMNNFIKNSMTNSMTNSTTSCLLRADRIAPAATDTGKHANTTRDTFHVAEKPMERPTMSVHKACSWLAKDSPVAS